MPSRKTIDWCEFKGSRMVSISDEQPPVQIDRYFFRITMVFDNLRPYRDSNLYDTRFTFTFDVVLFIRGIKGNFFIFDESENFAPALTYNEKEELQEMLMQNLELAKQNFGKQNPNTVQGAEEEALQLPFVFAK